MSENLGSIKYNIDIDTSEMLKAEAIVNKSLENQVSSFNKADKAIRSYEKVQEGLGRKINKLGQVIDGNGNIVAIATGRYRSLSAVAGKSFSDLSASVSESASRAVTAINKIPEKITEIPPKLNEVSASVAKALSGFNSYSITVDAADMLKAEAKIKPSIGRLALEFDRADSAVRNYEKSLKSAGATINAAGQVTTKNGKIIEYATRKYRELSSTAEAAFERVSRSASRSSGAVNSNASAVKKAGDATSKSSFQASNFSYQLQDMAVQAQMGTNGFIIMSQQLPQMMVGMGGVASAIGAVIAIGGLLATTLIDITSDSTKLNQAIERTKAVMTLGAGGIVEYTQKMQDLGRISEYVAQHQIKNAMNDAKEGIKLAVKSMADELASVDDVVFGVGFGFAVENQATIGTKAMRDYAVNVGNLLGVAGNAYDRSGDKAQEAGVKFVKLFASLKQAETPKEITSIQEELIKMATASDKADKKFAKMFISLMNAKDGSEDYFTKLRQLTAVLEQGAKGQSDFSNKANEAKDSVSSMTNEMLTQIEELKNGERAAYKYQLQLQGLSETEKDALLTLYDKKIALEENNQALADAEAANEAYENSVRNKTAADLAWFEQQEQWLKNQEKQETATLTTQVQSIGLTPEAEIQARYDKELELLKQAEERKIQIEGTYAERRNQIELERQEALRGMQGETNEFMTAAFGNLETQIAGTLAQVVVGAKDGKEAMAALANTILTQVIGAVVQWGIAEVTKLFTVETAEKGIQAANAAATTASVSAQVGMNTALAAQNAFMSTAAIPVIGPALAPAAAAAAGAASASIGATAIPLAPLAGARQYGGPVSSGMYRVNETGTPEVYSQGNKDYLMNTKNANITPLDKVGGGSQAPQIIVNNNSPERAYVTHDEVANITRVQIGKESKKASQGRGVMYQGLSKGTNVRNNARKG